MKVLKLTPTSSFRFPDMFPEGELVRDLQRELDGLIEDGVAQIVTLLRNSDPRMSKAATETEDTFIMDQRKKSSRRGSKIFVCTFFFYIDKTLPRV